MYRESIRDEYGENQLVCGITYRRRNLESVSQSGVSLRRRESLDAPPAEKIYADDSKPLRDKIITFVQCLSCGRSTALIICMSDPNRRGERHSCQELLESISEETTEATDEHIPLQHTRFHNLSRELPIRRVDIDLPGLKDIQPVYASG
jgi:hypothetical protein